MRKSFVVKWLSVVFSVALFVPSGFGGTPKYVILFIGDGMGPNQRELSEKVSAQTGRGKLEMNHLPVQGEACTGSANSPVTDSAAAATAIGCGVKTNNGMLGVTPDEKPVNSVTADARNAGWKVGVISTVGLNHATPAGFYAHVKSRDMYDEILRQAAGSKVDFFGGPNFIGDENNVVKTLSDGGYEVVKGIPDSAKLPKLPCAILNIPSLADVTRAAITLLNNPKGFFIMIEGGSIDGYCHGNDFPGAVRETIGMNDAVRVALEFYKQHPEDTLIVVTADHETGGLTVVKEVDFKKLPAVKSPGEVEGILNDMAKQKLSGDDFIAKLAEALSLEAISDKDRQIILDLYGKNQITGDKSVKNEAIRLMNDQAGITWTTGGHTGVPVPTTAIGPGSDAFKGTYENTHIADAIRGFITQSTEKKSSTE